MLSYRRDTALQGAL